MQKLPSNWSEIVKPVMIFGLWARFILLGGLNIFLIRHLIERINVSNLQISTSVIAETISIIILIVIVMRYFFLTPRQKEWSAAIWANIGVLILIGLSFYYIGKNIFGADTIIPGTLFLRW